MELQLRDRLVPRIVLGRHVSIPPREDADIDIGLTHVTKTLVERSRIGRDIVFHRNDIMTERAQRLVHSLPMLFEVGEGRRDIDLQAHDPTTSRFRGRLPSAGVNIE